MTDKEIIKNFREKTDTCFHKIGGYVPSQIEALVLQMIKEKLEKENVAEYIDLIDIVVSGSRSRGFEHEGSDLDVVLEFKSDFWREDSLFNLLNEEGFNIDGIKIDINPITEEKSGNLATYLLKADKYLEEQEAKENDLLLKKSMELNTMYGCCPFIFGDMVSLPAEYDDDLSLHEQKRLVEIIQKQLAKRKSSIEQQIEEANEKTNSTEIDIDKLSYYLKEDMILEFDSAEECMDYFNTYDYQNFKTIEEMKAFQGEYGFSVGSKWYHVYFDEALDVWKKSTGKDKESEKKVGLNEQIKDAEKMEKSKKNNRTISGRDAR